MTEQTDDAIVRYGVKELLAIQGETLKRIETKVEQGNVTQAETNAKFDLRLALVEALNVGSRLEKLERFRYAFPSVAVLAALAAAANTVFWFVHG